MLPVVASTDSVCFKPLEKKLKRNLANQTRARMKDPKAREPKWNLRTLLTPFL